MKQKKHWYDYLWIASLTYLVLGFFNILFAWLGLLCFFIPLIISLVKGNKGYCNRYCGRGQLFGLLGGQFGLSRKRDIPAWMQRIPIWFPDILPGHVPADALEHLAGVLRRKRAETGCDASVDLPGSLALGLPSDRAAAGCCPVCLWLLQRHADLHHSGDCHYGTV